MYKIRHLIFVLSFLALASSCSNSDEDALIGNWKYIRNQMIIQRSDVSESERHELPVIDENTVPFMKGLEIVFYEFLRAGRLEIHTYEYPSEKYLNTRNASYKVENDVIVIWDNTTRDTFHYRIDKVKSSNLTEETLLYIIEIYSQDELDTSDDVSIVNATFSRIYRKVEKDRH